MMATVTHRRPTVLVIHDDGEMLDQLTRLFEASGFEAVTAVSSFRAQQHLEGQRSIDVIVAPWDTRIGVGGDVYRWSLQQRYDLRDQFVFLAAEPPVEFDRVVAGRCVTVSPSRVAEIVRCAQAAVTRHEKLEAGRDAAEVVDGHPRPTLLLADDDPALLDAMGDLLREEGYAVTTVESGSTAMAELVTREFDAILTDWNMDDGSGADLYRWICNIKPELATRVVFLSGQEGDDSGTVAPGRPMFRKGQDSAALKKVLREVVRQVRGELSNPTLRLL